MTVGKTKKGLAYRAHWSREPTKRDEKALEALADSARVQMVKLGKARAEIVAAALFLVREWENEKRKLTKQEKALLRAVFNYQAASREA